MKDKTIEALKIVFQLEHILTGSRAFGGHTLDSDFDFCVPYKEETKALLEQMGFSVKHYNNDPNIHTCLSLGQVDVQLMKDFPTRKEAIQLLLVSGMKPPLGKKATQVWIALDKQCRKLLKPSKKSH
jgi:hypothetical protein